MLASSQTNPIISDPSRLWMRGIGLAVLLITLAGCDILSDETSPLDEALRETLVSVASEQSASSQGVEYFLLPASTDLSAIPQDPRNPLTPAKIELGKLLFHEPGLLTDPRRPEGALTGSCATCHSAEFGFGAGVRQGIGEGGIGVVDRHRDPRFEDADIDVQPLRSPTAMNTAYQEVMLWNGQFGATGPNAGTQAHWTAGTPIETNALGFHGLETQAIAGLKVHRMTNIEESVAATNATYRALFAEAFPGAPIDRTTAGLAIAAYERTLLANNAPFQRWLRGDGRALSASEKRGGTVFFGKAQCATCHTGPALSSMTFHTLGMGDFTDDGLLIGDFNDNPAGLGRASFTGDDSDRFRFKTPQLYNLADMNFYGHGGDFASVRAVVEYKRRAEPINPLVSREELSSQFVPLQLTDREVDDLVAFLETGLRDPSLARYEPTSLPSGNCFPNADQGSREERDCE